jgi:Carboxypeptidase regulatory-like domain
MRRPSPTLGPEARARWCLPRRLVLAMLATSVALLATAPPAGAIANGEIFGTITHEGAPLNFARAEVFNSETHTLVTAIVTGPSGTYSASLQPGTYKVLFSSGFPEAKLIPQYYNEQNSWETATPVLLTSGEKREINPVLRHGGTISGTVTDTSSHALEAQIEAIPADKNEFYVPAEVPTGTGGKYEIKDLPKGSYKVHFFAKEGQNLVPQYYSNKLTSSEANELLVTEEKNTSPINAELSLGGTITGTVTDAVSHRPIASVGVAAINFLTETFAFGETNANGEYRIIALPTGVYALGFEQSIETPEYQFQERRGVGVVQGSVTSGINVALEPIKPVNTAPPVASGTPALGQTLTCSRGTWAGLKPLGFSYKWLRDGSASGSSGSTYVVQASDEGHGLACEVIASNRAGRASAKSNTLTVPPPPPPPPPNSQFSLVGNPAVNEQNGQISIAGNFPATGGVSATGIVRHGATLARLTPASAYAVSSKRCKRRFVRKRGKCVSDAPVRYGASTLPVYLPGTYTITIKPTARVLKALKAGKRLSVTVSITFQNAKGGAPVTHSQTVTAKIKRPHHK